MNTRRIEKLETIIDRMVIHPPAILISYLNEQKTAAGPEEKKIQSILDQWMNDIIRAIKRSRISPEEVLTLWPKPFKRKLVDELRILQSESKKNGKP